MPCGQSRQATCVYLESDFSIGMTPRNNQRSYHQVTSQHQWVPEQWSPDQSLWQCISWRQTIVWKYKKPGEARSCAAIFSTPNTIRWDSVLR